jgi:hypothetical protein
MTTVSMLLGNVTSGYAVKNSLRFRASNTAYLNRTPASASNRTTWTWSGWVKLGYVSGATPMVLFCARSDNSNYTNCFFDSPNNTLYFRNVIGGTATMSLATSQVFRDPSAWYHCVFVWDSTNATAANRQKIYINGAQVTAFGTSTSAGASENSWWDGAFLHQIGNYPGNSNYLDGYLAEVNFIDGQALTASSFGTYDINGVWQPIKYSGSFGTNGFYLNFGNTASTTTLGYDTSGNSNNWTTNNISLTAGSTYDSMTDSPTVSSSTIANYAVYNPLVPSTGTINNGNIGVSTTTTNATSTTFFPSTGKWYWENISTSGTQANTRFGIVNRNGAGADLGGSANGWAYLGDGRVYNNGSTSSYGVTYTTNDILMIALDLDAGKVWYGKNGTWMASGSPSTGANPSQTFTANQQMSPAVASGTGTLIYAINCGQQPFTYTPPTGYNALNTYNLPTPTIANGAQYMAATTYTGTAPTPLTVTNGGNNSIGTTFAPDFVWAKDRTAAQQYLMFDTLRGVYNFLSSNRTDAESSNNQTLTAFNSNGFTLGTNGTINGTVANIGWQWKAGGASGVSNTNGSITSTVSANTTAGFSVVTYTGTGANATVGHGLGVAPALIIFKSRSAAGNWVTYTSSLAATNGLYLNLTNASTATTAFNNTAPTSSVFSVGVNDDSNHSGTTYVAYCWAAVAGYSAFGSYTGNGSSDGPFIYTGFRPRYLLIKLTTGANSWRVVDSSRNPYNLVNLSLRPDASDAEYTNVDNCDFLSNGFKLRGTDGGNNGSGQTFIYAAYAENPFNSSRAR